MFLPMCTAAVASHLQDRFITMCEPNQILQSLQNEVPLSDPFTSPRERETMESLAEIYSLIIVLDQVEKAYLSESLSDEEYTVSVNKLLAQYKTYMSNEEVAKS